VGTNRGSVLSVRDSVNHWISFNNTEVIPLKKRFPNINLLDSSTVDSETYISGTEGTEVKLYTVTGGGHTEPSKQQKYSLVVESLLGRQNHDIEMAEQIWDFFQDKSL
jgi:polyhydroxybutyrate depolymerase